MSWVALAWASKLKVERASDKLILLALADRHNDETGFAYPSVAWLCDFSSLNRKTVISSLDRLETDGLIADSGRRVGVTKQIKVYSVLVEKTEQYPKRNSSEIGAKQSQKRYTEPVFNQHSGSKEPSCMTKPKTKPIARAFPEDWVLSIADREYAIKQGLAPKEIERAVEDFRGHFIAAGTRKSTNWSLNWQGWCRRAVGGFGRGRANLAGSQNARSSRSGVDDIASIVARRHAEDDARMEVPGRQASIFADNHDWSDGAIEGEYRAGSAEGRNGHDPRYPQDR